VTVTAQGRHSAGESAREPCRDPHVPPCIEGGRLLGAAVELRRDRLGLYERAMRELGDVVRVVLGPPGRRLELYCVFHPDGVHRVLAGSRETYTKGSRGFRLLAEEIGWGLLSSEGELWRRQRRLIQPLFTVGQVRGYAALMADETMSVVERWAGANGVVDAHAEMTRLTLRVLGRAVFGQDMGEAIEVVRRDFPLLGRHWYRRVTSPVSLPSSWPTPRNAEARRAREELYEVVDRLIERRRQASADGDDLLSRLLAARDPATGAPMPLQQVRDEALIFLLAGHDTTATALTFTLHLLGRHPAEQQLARDEVEQVLAGRAPTADDVAALPHTTMVIKEAMRLFPSAPGFTRRCETDDELGGYRIPAGANVLVSPWATHRHPAFWDQPERFDPNRFAPEREAERHRWAYFPFGGGPRACIGAHFSMLEMTIALAMLAQRFRLRAEPRRPRLDAAGITLRPAEPVPIQLTTRRRTS
jgi:cytochrome P450